MYSWDELSASIDCALIKRVIRELQEPEHTSKLEWCLLGNETHRILEVVAHVSSEHTSDDPISLCAVEPMKKRTFYNLLDMTECRTCKKQCTTPLRNTLIVRHAIDDRPTETCEFCQRVPDGTYKQVWAGGHADVYQGRELHKWMFKVKIHVCPTYSDCSAKRVFNQAFPSLVCLVCGRDLTNEAGREYDG